MQKNRSENCDCADLTFEKAWNIASDIVGELIKDGPIILLSDYFRGMILLPKIGFDAMKHWQAIDYVYERYANGGINGDEPLWSERYFKMLDADEDRKRLESKYANWDDIIVPK
jgi:hypothetical protein